MYFTPDGRYAIVVAERLHRLDFRDAHTFKLAPLAARCRAPASTTWTSRPTAATRSSSCEFSGQLLKVDVARERVVGVLTLRPGAAPQDVKLSPDGTRLLRRRHERRRRLARRRRRRSACSGSCRPARGAHGLYPSRDARYLYVTNRGAGSISVVSFATRRIVAHLAHPGRRQPRHGERLRRRQGAVADRPLQRRRLRDQHERTAGCSRRSRSARARTGSASGRSPAGTRSGTRASLRVARGARPTPRGARRLTRCSSPRPCCSAAPRCARPGGRRCGSRSRAGAGRGSSRARPRADPAALLRIREHEAPPRRSAAAPISASTSG